MSHENIQYCSINISFFFFYDLIQFLILGFKIYIKFKLTIVHHVLLLWSFQIIKLLLH